MTESWRSQSGARFPSILSGFPLAGWTDTATKTQHLLEVSVRRAHTYIGSVWQRDIASGPGVYSQASPVFVLGADLEHARTLAREMLPVSSVEGTAWTIDREMRAAPYVVIRRRETRRMPDGCIARVVVGRCEFVQPEKRIVPSIGELGYTP